MTDYRIRARDSRAPNALADRLNEILVDIARRVEAAETTPAIAERLEGELAEFRAALPAADSFARSLSELMAVRDVVVARSAEVAGAVSAVTELAAIVAAGNQSRAPLASPALTGTPTAPTAPAGTNTNQLATAAFVQIAVAALKDTLTNGAGPALDTLQELAAALGNDANFATTITNALAGKQPLDADLTAIAALATTAFGRSLLTLANDAAGRAALGAAPLASPALTGVPTAPTAPAGTNTGQIATAAFVQAAIDVITTALAGKQGADADLTAIASLSTTAFGRSLLELANDAAGRAALGAAPLASPALTGTPTAPTAPAGTNTTQLATAAFVQAAIASLVASSPATLDTLNELAAALGNDPNFATTITTALGGKQPLDADLTAIAALATTAFGRDFLALADDVAARTKLATDTVYPRLDGANAGPLGGSRNRLLNPNFAIKQRLDASGVVVGSATDFWISDRWRMRGQSETGGSVTLESLRSQIASYAATGGAYLRINRTSALTTPFAVSQRLEGLRYYAGRKVAVSVTAQDDGAGTAAVTLRQVFGSGGSATYEETKTTAALTTTSSNLARTLVFDLPGVDGKTVADGAYFEVAIAFSTLAVGFTRLLHVQLEFGEIATPPETRLQALEEALCRRYFERLKGPHARSGFATAATTALFALAYQPKRVAPALSATLTGAKVRDRATASAAPDVTALSFVTATLEGEAMAQASVASGLTAGAGCILTSAAGSYIDVDAEL